MALEYRNGETIADVNLADGTRLRVEREGGSWRAAHKRNGSWHQAKGSTLHFAISEAMGEAPYSRRVSEVTTFVNVMLTRL